MKMLLTFSFLAVMFNPPATSTSLASGSSGVSSLALGLLLASLFTLFVLRRKVQS
jgi:hypothetical protein